VHAAFLLGIAATALLPVDLSRCLELPFGVCFRFTGKKLLPALPPWPLLRSTFAHWRLARLCPKDFARTGELNIHAEILFRAHSCFETHVYSLGKTFNIISKFFIF